MQHFTTPAFWEAYDRLPENIRKTADRSFETLKRDPKHPALHFKRVGRYRSARVSVGYRVLGVDDGEDVVWFWIGSHADYDRLLKR